MATIAVAATSPRATRPRILSTTSSSSSSSSSTSSLCVFASSASFTHSRTPAAASRSRKRASWLSTVSEKPNWKDTAPQSVIVVDNDDADDEARVPESPPSSPLPLNFGIRNFTDTDLSESKRRQGPQASSLCSQPVLRKTRNLGDAKSASHSTSTITGGTASMSTGYKGQSRNPTVTETRPRFTVSTVVHPRPRISGLGLAVPASSLLSPSVVSPSKVANVKTPSPSTRAKTIQKNLTSSIVKEGRVDPKARSASTSVSPGNPSPAKATAASGNKFSKSRVTTTTTTTTRVASKTVTTAVRTEKNSGRKTLTTPITTTAKITNSTTGSKVKDSRTKKGLDTATAATECETGVMSTKAGSLVTKEIATTLQSPSTLTRTQNIKCKNDSPSSSSGMALDRTRTGVYDDLVVGSTASFPISSSSAVGTSSFQTATTLLLPALEVDSPAPEPLATDYDKILVMDVLRIKEDGPKPDNGYGSINSPPNAHQPAIPTNQGQAPKKSTPPCIQPFLSRVDTLENTFSQDEVALHSRRPSKPTTTVSTRLPGTSGVTGVGDDPAIVAKSFESDRIPRLVGSLGTQEAIDVPKTKDRIDQKSCRIQETRQLDRISIRTAMGLRPTESPLLKVRDPSAMNLLLKVMKDHRDFSGLGGLTKAPMAVSEIQKDTLSTSSRATPPVVHTFLSRRSRAKAAFELLTSPSPASSVQHQHRTSDYPVPITFAAKQAYVHLQAQKRQATSVAAPSRDLFRSWTTDPLKYSLTTPTVVLASPIAISASADFWLDSSPSYKIHSQHHHPPPPPAQSLSALLNSAPLSGLSPRLTRPTLTMAGLSVFPSPRTSPRIRDSTVNATVITTPPRLKAQRSTSFLDTRTVESEKDSSAPSPQEFVPGDPYSNGGQASWLTSQSLPIARIVVSQPPITPGLQAELQTPVASTFSTFNAGPEHDITLLTRRLSNIQLIDTLCPTTGMTISAAAADSAKTMTHGWMDATWAMQIQQLLIHLSAQADLEAESKPRRQTRRCSDVQGRQILMTDGSKGLFEQLLSDWIQRMDQLPQSVFRDHPGLKREVDKIRWQHNFLQKKIK